MYLVLFATGCETASPGLRLSAAPLLELSSALTFSPLSSAVSTTFFYVALSMDSSPASFWSSVAKKISISPLLRFSQIPLLLLLARHAPSDAEARMLEDWVLTSKHE